MITVHQIGRTFVKATQFTNPETVEVLASGIRGDRDFFLLERIHIMVLILKCFSVVELEL